MCLTNYTSTHTAHHTEVTVGFEVEIITVDEGDETYMACVELNRAVAEDVTVNLETEDGDAIDGSGTLTHSHAHSLTHTHTQITLLRQSQPLSL